MQRADAGAFQALGARALGQAQDALGHVQPVLGAMLQQLLDDLGGGRPDAERLRPAGFPATDQAVDLVRRQVRQDGLALARLAGAVVDSDGVMVVGEQLELAALDAWEPDIALLDIRMPDLNGYELARLIGARAAGKPRLVAVTGMSGEVARREGFRVAAEAEIGLEQQIANSAELLLRKAVWALPSAPLYSAACWAARNGWRTS